MDNAERERVGEANGGKARAWILREAYLYDSAMAFVRGGRGNGMPCLRVGLMEYWSTTGAVSDGWMDGGRGRLAASSSVWI